MAMLRAFPNDMAQGLWLPFRAKPLQYSPQEDERRLLQQNARHHGAKLYLDKLPHLAEGYDIETLRDLLSKGCLPLKSAGAITPIATSSAHHYYQLKPKLEASIGPTAMSLAPQNLLEASLYKRYGPHLAKSAEELVPKEESARGWGGRSYRMASLLLAVLVLTSFVAHPFLMLSTALALAVISQLMLLAFKISTAIAAHRIKPEEISPLDIIQLPKITVMAALYKEARISEKLIKRLQKLDYPKELLEVLLVIEEDDLLTRNAIEARHLPEGFKMVCVPKGQIKTKPRALNYALPEASGKFIGIYDAEDAPESDQLRKVVDHFYRRGPEVACLQGRLDYYNPYTNWISRCFTMEYGNWFRVFLPGVAALGLAVPLGGTTLFFRRDVLVKLGGWDAHNVTEDADLGVRLYRHGYRTEMLDSTTFEEANCRPIPWVKQRSRWIKGYIVTWMVHMRHPLKLYRQIGRKRFIALQIQLLLPSVQVLLAPLLWSFLPMSLGMSHPLEEHLTPALTWTAIGIFLLSAAIDVTISTLALRRGVHEMPKYWALALFAYFPLATFAAYKALYELCLHPYYWDKTSHGLFNATASSARPHRPEAASQRLRSNAS